MPQISNKNNETANIEAVDLAIADVSANDYESKSAFEHFGLLLADSATLRVVTLDDTEITFTFPAGWNPVALKAIKNHVDNTITSIQVFY